MSGLAPDVLTSLARAAIAASVGGKAAAPVVPGASGAATLAAPGAVFVTLTRGDGELRGCIGSLSAHRSLGSDVEANAVAAATRDPRFPPVTADELPDLHVEVSVLSAPEPVGFTSEADALAQLVPGVHGAVLEFGNHRGTFLPQVWESLPEPSDFWAQLKRKAGLPTTWWDPGARLSRYTVTAHPEPT